MKIKSKKIWITGSSSGLGKELALKFAQEGWQVGISARRVKHLINISKLNKNIHVFQLDIKNKVEVKKTFKKILKKFKSLDSCIFNSGIFERNNKSIDDVMIKRLMETNFFGTVNCVSAVERYFKKKRSGKIAIVASTSGYKGLSSISGYGASKAALINFTESLYLMMNNYGVQASVINPGFIKTPLIKKNNFKMPLLMDPDKAADIIFNELTNRDNFEIILPKIFVNFLKILKILPYKFYFFLIKKKIIYKIFYR